MHRGSYHSGKYRHHLVILLAALLCPCLAIAEPKEKPIKQIEEKQDDGIIQSKVEYGKSTGLPLPRFVSLKSRETNWRNGPGYRYPIKWVYSQRGYPVQVIAEFDSWRKVRDVDGEDGWVHEALISGQRHVVVIADHSHKANDSIKGQDNGQLKLYRKPDESSYPVAKLEVGVLARLKKCQEHWCKIQASGYYGWARKENLWGCYQMKLSNRVVFIAADHAGVELKKLVCEYLAKHKAAFIDLGPTTTESVDYPDYAAKLSQRMKDEPGSIGLLICGTGIGMSIAANRHKHIRAALCNSAEYARLAREHNDANVLVLGARFTPEALAMEIVDVFLSTNFAGGRHSARVEKLG